MVQLPPTATPESTDTATNQSGANLKYPSEAEMEGLLAGVSLEDVRTSNDDNKTDKTQAAVPHNIHGSPVNMHVSFRYRHLPDLYRTYRIPFAHTGLVPFHYLHTGTGTIPANVFVGQYHFTIGIVAPAIYRQISSGPVSS